MKTTKRTCGKCDKEKDETLFDWAKKSEGKRHRWCKECTSAAKKASYAKHRDAQLQRVNVRKAMKKKEAQDKVLAYLLSHPCIDCGEVDPVVLHFDHLRDKTLGVSEMVCNGYNWEIIEAEIAKCEVRCANCHIKRTRKQFNWTSRQYVPVV